MKIDIVTLCVPRIILQCVNVTLCVPCIILQCVNVTLCVPCIILQCVNVTLCVPCIILQSVNDQRDASRWSLTHYLIIVSYFLVTQFVFQSQGIAKSEYFGRSQLKHAALLYNSIIRYSLNVNVIKYNTCRPVTHVRLVTSHSTLIPKAQRKKMRNFSL